MATIVAHPWTPRKEEPCDPTLSSQRATGGLTHSPLPGRKIIVIQTGGVIDGVNYHVEGETMLAAGESYLLFATDSFDGAFAILGGSAGTYLSSGDGIFVAAAPEVAPSERFTTSEVASLTE